MDKIDGVLGKFFEVGDRYRLAAPVTHLVAIFFKAAKDLTTGVFRVDLSRYQSRCFDYLNKKSYKVCALLIIPIWGFGYVQKHRLYYYKTDDKKLEDNDLPSIPQITENVIIEQPQQLPTKEESYKLLIDQSEESAETFVKDCQELELEKLDTKVRISLLQHALVKGGEKVQEVIKNNFVHLGFKKEFKELATHSQRQEFINDILELGAGITNSLVADFAKQLSKLEINKRLEICHRIAEVGEVAVEALVSYFDDLGFIKKLESLEADAFLKECEGLKEWQALGLLENLMLFNKKKLSGILLTKKERFAFCQMMKDKSGNVFMALLNKMEKLNLYEDFNALESSEERFEFINEMSLIHRELVRVFSYDGFALMRELSSEERILLSRHIASKAGTAKGLASGFSLCFDFKNLNETEAMELFKKLLCIGEEMIDPLLESCHFNFLGVDKLSTEKQLSFYKYILEQGGEYLAASFISSKNIKLDVFEPEIRLKICVEVMGKGALAVKALTENLEKVGSLPLELQTPFLTLIRALSKNGKGGLAAKNIFDPSRSTLVPNISMKRQVLLELLLAPRALNELLTSPYWIDLKGALKDNVDPNQDVIDPIRVLLPFLIKKWDAITGFTETEVENLKEFLSRDERLKPLLVFLNKIEEKEMHVQRQLLKWVAYTAGVCFNTETVDHNDMLALICQYRHPSLRFFLVRQFSEVKKLLAKPSTKKNVKIRAAEDFANLLISRWVELGLDEKKGIEILKKIVENSFLFKDTKQLEKLLSFLSKTIENPGDKEENILRYQSLVKILEDDKTCLTNLSSLNSLLNIFCKEKFKICVKDFIEDKKTLGGVFLESFQEMFPIENIENFSECYEATFGSCRNPTALFVYLGSVNKLLGTEKERVFAALKSYVEAVLKKNFSTYRYQTETHPHLKKIFEAKPEIKEIWTKRKPFTPLILAEEVSEKKMDYKDFLQKKIAEKHIDIVDVPVLEGYLKGEITFEEAKKQLSNKSGSSQFQLLAMNLCEEKIQVELFVRKVRGLKKFDLKGFENDLQVLLPQKATGKYTIGISDDWQDLLLIGTEVNGSCQHVNGEPDKNKCLVGYFPGDALPIIVKDGNGKIIARSFLRLLWDETNKTAVLLLERLYSNLGDHKSICEAISGVAFDLAKEMKVPLVSKEIKVENKRPYKGKVQFLGGSAPFIYTDAGGGIKNGQRPFEIIGCHEIL